MMDSYYSSYQRAACLFLLLASWALGQQTPQATVNDIAVLSSPFALELTDVPPDLDVVSEGIVETTILDFITKALQDGNETEIVLEDVRWLYYDYLRTNTMMAQTMEHAIIVFRTLVVFRDVAAEDRNATSSDATRFIVDDAITETFSSPSSKRAFVAALQASNDPSLTAASEPTIGVYEPPQDVPGDNRAGPDNDDDDGRPLAAWEIALIAACCVIFCAMLCSILQHHHDQSKALYLEMGDDSNSTATVAKAPSVTNDDVSVEDELDYTAGRYADVETGTVCTPVITDPHQAETPKMTNTRLIEPLERPDEISADVYSNLYSQFRSKGDDDESSSDRGIQFRSRRSVSDEQLMHSSNLLGIAPQMLDSQMEGFSDDMDDIPLDDPDDGSDSMVDNRTKSSLTGRSSSSQDVDDNDDEDLSILTESLASVVSLEKDAETVYGPDYYDDEGGSGMCASESDDILSSLTDQSLESLKPEEHDHKENWFRETRVKHALAQQRQQREQAKQQEEEQQQEQKEDEMHEQKTPKDTDHVDHVDNMSTIFHVDAAEYTGDGQSQMSGMSNVAKWLDNIRVVGRDNRRRQQATAGRRAKANDTQVSSKTSKEHTSIESPGVVDHVDVDHHHGDDDEEEHSFNPPTKHGKNEDDDTVSLEASLEHSLAASCVCLS